MNQPSVKLGYIRDIFSIVFGVIGVVGAVMISYASFKSQITDHEIRIANLEKQAVIEYQTNERHFQEIKDEMKSILEKLHSIEIDVQNKQPRK